MIAAPELDELMLSFCLNRWQKVAMIAAKTYQAFERRGMEISGATAKAFDARMAVLVRTGRLEAKGNIREWRYSEVRLPVAAGKADEPEA